MGRQAGWEGSAPDFPAICLHAAAIRRRLPVLARARVAALLRLGPRRIEGRRHPSLFSINRQNI
jgi:hypothetical protein